jgi:hypothetical protein
MDFHARSVRHVEVFQMGSVRASSSEGLDLHLGIAAAERRSWHPSGHAPVSTWKHRSTVTVVVGGFGGNGDMVGPPATVTPT